MKSITLLVLLGIFLHIYQSSAGGFFCVNKGVRCRLLITLPCCDGRECAHDNKCRDKCRKINQSCGYGTCCSDLYCDGGHCHTCITSGNSDFCNANNQCCDSHCVQYKCVRCLPKDNGCEFDSECCSNNCKNKHCVDCVGLNKYCDTIECCFPNVCDHHLCSKCYKSGHVSAHAKDCCTKQKSTYYCCNSNRVKCTTDEECCSGRCYELYGECV